MSPLGVIPPLEIIERLALAGVLGALIGAEREWRQKDAGLRTNTLIALGSALFTLAAIELAGGEPGTASRIPAQVASGVGFIGGGAILRGRHDIHGLTTAATIWVNAAIGMAAGAGAYALAAMAAGTVLVVLTAFLPLQRYLERHRPDRDGDERGRTR